MIILDTDHTTFLKYRDSARGRRLIDRLNAAPASEVIGVAIVTVEERMRGWLAVIAKRKLHSGKSLATANWPCSSSSITNSKLSRLMKMQPNNSKSFVARNCVLAQEI